MRRDTLNHATIGCVMLTSQGQDGYGQQSVDHFEYPPPVCAQKHVTVMWCPCEPCFISIWANIAVEHCPPGVYFLSTWSHLISRSLNTTSYICISNTRGSEAIWNLAHFCYNWSAVAKIRPVQFRENTYKVSLIFSFSYVHSIKGTGTYFKEGPTGGRRKPHTGCRGRGKDFIPQQFWSMQFGNGSLGMRLGYALSLFNCSVKFGVC